MCNFWQSCAKMSTLRVRADLVDRWLIIRLAFRALVAHQWPMAHHPGSDGSLAPARKEAWPEPAERERAMTCATVWSVLLHLTIMHFALVVGRSLPSGTGICPAMDKGKAYQLFEISLGQPGY